MAIIKNPTTIVNVGSKVDFTLANATETDVLSGKTFYAGDSTIKTGTLVVSGESLVEKDINFYDYDGTLLNSYLLSDLPLASLPTNPIHSGLTFQEWNYTLEQINATTHKLDIGAIFITDDGKTRVYMTLTTVSGFSPTIYFMKFDASTLQFRLIKLSDSSVVWTDSISSSGSVYNKTISGVTEAGNYMLEMWLSNKVGAGAYYIGGNDMPFTFIGGTVQNYNNTVTKVNIGNDVNVYGYVFNGCRNLSEITVSKSKFNKISTHMFTDTNLNHINIPSNITDIDDYAFYDCRSLESISLPNGITHLGSQCFYFVNTKKIIINNNITSLETPTFSFYNAPSYFFIPTNLNELPSSFFNFSYGIMDYIYIPNNILSIGASSLTGKILELDFTDFTAIPTLVSTNAFTLNALSKIKVPSALYNDWIVATNWVSIANYIEAV
jgi:hypothetical protein